MIDEREEDRNSFLSLIRESREIYCSRKRTSLFIGLAYLLISGWVLLQFVSYMFGSFVLDVGSIVLATSGLCAAGGIYGYCSISARETCYLLDRTNDFSALFLSYFKQVQNEPDPSFQMVKQQLSERSEGGAEKVKPNVPFPVKRLGGILLFGIAGVTLPAFIGDAGKGNVRFPDRLGAVSSNSSRSPQSIEREGEKDPTVTLSFQDVPEKQGRFSDSETQLPTQYQKNGENSGSSSSFFEVEEPARKFSPNVRKSRKDQKRGAGTRAGSSSRKSNMLRVDEEIDTGFDPERNHLVEDFIENEDRSEKMRETGTKITRELEEYSVGSKREISLQRTQAGEEIPPVVRNTRDWPAQYDRSIRRYYYELFQEK